MQAQLTSMAARRGSVASGLQFLSHIKACRMLFIVTLVYFLGFLPYMLMDRYVPKWDLFKYSEKTEIQGSENRYYMCYGDLSDCVLNIFLYK